MNPTKIDTRALPYRIRQIADQIGIEATYDFLCKHGAQLVTVPERYTDDCSCSKRFGKDAAQALIALWPGARIDLPKPDKILRQLRDIQLQSDLENGISTMELVKKYNLTRQRIWQITGQQETKNMSLPLDLGD